MGIQTVEAIFPLFLQAVSAQQVNVEIDVYDGTS